MEERARQFLYTLTCVVSLPKTMTKPKKDECAECGSRNVHYNKKKQQIVCRACGAIFEELAPQREKKFEKAHDQG